MFSIDVKSFPNATVERYNARGQNMATVHKTIESLQNLLDDELTDYNSDRDGRWIYNIPIEFGMAQYPRIHIRQVSSPHQAQSIGTNERFMESRIRVNIFNHVDGKFDIDNDGADESSLLVLDTLKDEIIELINNNQSRWKDVEDCHIYSVTTESDESFNPNREDVMGWTVYAIIRRRK